MARSGFLLLAVLAAAGCGGQAVEAPAAGPRLVVSPSDVNLGAIGSYAPVAASINIANAGDAPLEIRGISTSCSCTAASEAKPRLEPGESFDLKLKVTPKQRGGLLEEEVTIDTNDPAGLVKIAVRGEIADAVRVLPQEFVIETDFEGKGETELTLESADGSEIRIIEVKPPEGLALADGAPAEASGAHRLAFRAEGLEGARTIRGAIEIRTDKSPNELMLVPATIIRPRLLAAYPSNIVIVGEGAEFEREVQISRNDGAPFRVISATSESAEINGEFAAEDSPEQTIVFRGRATGDQEADKLLIQVSGVNEGLTIPVLGVKERPVNNGNGGKP